MKYIIIIIIITTSSHHHHPNYSRFEVFTALKIQVEVFWVVTLYIVVAGYQRFQRSMLPEDGGSIGL
jgi:hypothetical protein